MQVLRGVGKLFDPMHEVVNKTVVFARHRQNISFSMFPKLQKQTYAGTKLLNESPF